MRIGVMSDSHDYIPNVRKAVEVFNREKVDLVVHCGDYIAPFIIKELSRLKPELIGVFGNNDGDRGLLDDAADAQGFKLSGQPLELELSGFKIVVFHGFGRPETTALIARALAETGKYRAVIYGHTHQPMIEKHDGCIVLNPGETFGFLTGRATVALLDLEKCEAELVELA